MNISPPEISSRLQQLTGNEFEHFVADIWEERGWETSVTKRSRDEGIDVIAERSMPYTERVLIQTKRYKPNQKVGPREIREYHSTRDQRENVDKVLVVTTSEFTKNAKKIANDLNVKIINGRSLAQIITESDSENILVEYTSKPDSTVKLPGEESLDSPETTSSNSSSPSLPSAKSDILRVEMTGLRWGETQLKIDPESTFLGEKPDNLEGYVITLELYNKTGRPQYIEEKLDVEIVSWEGEIFHPVQLTPNSLPNGWKSFGGGFVEGSREYAIHIPPSSKAKSILGVTMPKTMDVYGLIIEKFGVGIELERDMYSTLSNVPNEVENLFQGQ